MVETFELDRAPLAAAVRQTFERRETALPQEKPTGLSEAYVDTWGDQWRTFLNRERMAAVPEQPATVVADLERFVLPLIEDAGRGLALEARHRVDSENTESVSMDVLYFLKERTRLIRDYYEHAARPFREITRKNEAEEERYIPPYSEDPERAGIGRPVSNRRGLAPNAVRYGAAQRDGVGRKTGGPGARNLRPGLC